MFVCRNDGHTVPVAIELGSPGSPAASQTVVYTPKSVTQVCLGISCVCRRFSPLLCPQIDASCFAVSALKVRSGFPVAWWSDSISFMYTVALAGLAASKLRSGIPAEAESVFLANFWTWQVWQLAKAAFTSIDSGVHQLISHFLRTHVSAPPFDLLCGFAPPPWRLLYSKCWLVPDAAPCLCPLERVLILDAASAKLNAEFVMKIKIHSFIRMQGGTLFLTLSTSC